MANIFAITTVTDRLKTEDGSATIVFTVTNTTSRPIRGIAKIKPMGNTQAQWLKIDGEIERDFPAGGTHQFTASFNKPKPPTSPNTSQPAESFPFRLDVISATDPQDDFTEGPVVTVEIPEQIIKPIEPIPWRWILIALGVLLVVGAIVAFLLWRSGGSENANNTATPTMTPTPAGIQVVYDFTEKAPSAIWITESGNILAFNGNAAPGLAFVKITKDAITESGSKEDLVIEIQPIWRLPNASWGDKDRNRSITGTYELPEPIDAKDRFRAKIGFFDRAGNGNFKVRLILNETVISELPKAYDGALREYMFDLGHHEGVSGKFALQIEALTDAQGRFCLVNPRIERVPQ